MEQMMLTGVLVFSVVNLQTVSGDDVRRTNIGVMLRDQGVIQTAASTWYHHFVVSLPKLDDLVPAKCLKRSDAFRSLCEPYEQASKSKIGELLLDMNNQVVQEFQQLYKTAKQNLPDLPRSSFGRNKRAAPLQFIGDLSRTIFGTATVEDLQRVAGKVNAIIERGNSLGEAMVQHEKNFESYMETNNHRVSELRQVVLNNHDEIVEVHNEAMSSINDSKEYAYANTDAIRRLNATMNMIMHLREVSESIRSMSRGVFPQHLISDAQLKMAIRNIKKMVRRSDPNFSVLHPDPDYFHKFGSFVAFLSKDSNIWITLKIPVGLKT